MFADLIRQLPFIRRPFFELDQAHLERSAAERKLVTVLAELETLRQVLSETSKCSSESNWRSKSFVAELKRVIPSAQFYISSDEDEEQDKNIGTFRDYIRNNIDLTGPVLELGPSFNPILSKTQGYNVCVVDHADQAGLREKYSAEGVNIDAIEPVDVVWTGGKLSEAVGGRKFAAIVASHVVEHAPDWIGFLNDLAAMLDLGGKIFLIVPDQRYCYDLLQPPTDVAKVLADHSSARSRHTFESYYREANQVVVNTNEQSMIWWSNQFPPNDLDIRFPNILDAFGTARSTSQSMKYRDVHANYFTPSNFLLLCIETFMLGLQPLNATIVSRSRGCEFLVVLEPFGRYQIDNYTIVRTLLQKNILHEQREKIECLKTVLCS